MINTAVDYIRNVDTFAAIDYICKQDDPFSVTSSFNDLIGHLYWENKDLAGVVALGRAGIQYGLAAASKADEVNPEAAKAIRLKTRALAYNVASYAWPGWDETNIEPNATDVALGYDAAKLLVRMVEEMDAEPIKYARAFWLLGGYQLAAGKSQRAEQSYNESAKYADKASAKGEVLLAKAFALFAVAQADSNQGNQSEAIEKIKAALGKEEHGPDFIEQIEAASRVFGILS
jgi:tetratricopeptide (TPR) repeat protein